MSLQRLNASSRTLPTPPRRMQSVLCIGLIAASWAMRMECGW